MGDGLRGGLLAVGVLDAPIDVDADVFECGLEADGNGA